MKRARRWFTWILILVGLPAAGVWLWRARQVQAKADLPVASARKGEFQVIVRCRGELISSRSVQLVAPMNVPGMVIAWQAPPNGEVKAGDVVVRFDSSLAKQGLLEKQAMLQQAQATLEQAGGQARITAEQDRLDLASALCKARKAGSTWAFPKRNCGCRRRPTTCTKRRTRRRLHRPRGCAIKRN